MQEISSLLRPETMIPFLEQIAAHFFDKHQRELYRYRIFLPNRRARLFFMHYLETRLGDTPILAPQITTLNEYVTSASTLVSGEKLILLFELYKCYVAGLSKEKAEATNFEGFYPIGELILQDFQDLDKHRSDAQKLFRNLYELKELENELSYLDEAQRAAISSFLKPLPSKAEDAKPLLKSFLSFWDGLYDLYVRYKDSLQRLGIGYDGMIMREACDRIESGTSPLGQDGVINVFVGLNALTPCEHRILRHLKENSETLFYWDYPSQPLQDKSPGAYFREYNLSHYPEPTGVDTIVRDSIEGFPEVEVVAIPSSVAQTAYIGADLKTLHLTQPESMRDLRVAVVLPNERLLIPMLNNIPAEVRHLNVTMGYPVRETPLVALLEQLVLILRKQKKAPSLDEQVWRGADVMQLLSMSVLSPYVGEIREKMSELIIRRKHITLTSKVIIALAEEACTAQDLTVNMEAMQLLDLIFATSPTEMGLDLFDYFINLLRFLSAQRLSSPEDVTEWNKDLPSDESPSFSAEKAILPHLLHLVLEIRHTLTHWHQEIDPIPLSVDTVADALLTVWRNARIPYSGEPLKGLQMMGMLETRGLDFDIVYIPDASEGILPQKRAVTGIIPYSLRFGYGLPTYEWQDRTRAYNFFKLISRAKRVVMTYDSRKSDLSQGEPSRYIRMLHYIYGVDVKYKTADYPLSPLGRLDSNDILHPELIAAYQKALQDPQSKVALSPSRLKTFVLCPRQFYYTVIQEINDQESLHERIESNDLGTIVHNSLESLYKGFIERYNGLIDKGQLQEWLRKDNTEVSKTVLNCFRKHVFGKDEGQPLRGYNLIQYEYAVSQVQSIIRKDKDYPRQLKYIGGEMKFVDTLYLSNAATINVKGIIDRIDLEGDCLRITDYKTGKDSYEISSNNATPRLYNSAATQLLFYCHVIQKMSSEHEFRQQLPDFASLRPIINKPHHRSKTGTLTMKDSSSGGRAVSTVIEDYAMVREWFEGFIDPILRDIIAKGQTFEPRPERSVCRYCPAFDLCEATAQPGTNEEYEEE